ncbi:MAG: pantoate--beta-alanine ligase [Syntrophorhabdaceae bacterium]|nr:pantoate--beta-alanine ligase [Syntrophorhabdaceae bacterium]
MEIVEKIKEMQEISEKIRKTGKRIGFVPTMGYLHEGHLALVRKAREITDIVIVSIFVNPIQFGPTEDLDRYPRDFERDSTLLEKERTDIIFFPDGKEMYPKGYSTYIQVRGLEDHLCGLTRKGHFTGVATVVGKLFNIVKPHVAVFGQKDYQQLKIIERMVKDLNMDVEIISYPTVREPDGLAMSSRNTYLSPEERQRALSIYRAIKRVEKLFKEGERDALFLKREAEKILTSEKGLEIEYISISDTENLEELSRIEKEAVLAIACRIGKTRLIDNTILMEG